VRSRTAYGMTAGRRPQRVVYTLPRYASLHCVLQRLMAQNCHQANFIMFLELEHAQLYAYGDD
jgi:hypothetical protein